MSRSDSNRSIFNDLVPPAGASASAERPIEPNTPLLPAFLKASRTHAQRQVGNPGLWWERYGFEVAVIKQEKIGRDKVNVSSYDIGKANWTANLVRMNGRNAGAHPKLREHADAMAAMVEKSGPGGMAFDMRLTSRLITGFGIANPIENGLLFHPVLGCPYIPGSSIKGAVQAFADEWLKSGAYTIEDIEGLTPLMDRIFGQPKRLNGGEHHEDGDTRLGSVVFHDAIPTEWPELVSEVMTPHVGSYLVSVPPEDFSFEKQSPKPIYYPAVKEGGIFRFMVAATNRAHPELSPEEANSDVSLAAGWLVACLRDMGLGAKTKSGYGRFELM